MDTLLESFIMLGSGSGSRLEVRSQGKYQSSDVKSNIILTILDHYWLYPKPNNKVRYRYVNLLKKTKDLMLITYLNPTYL